AFLEQGLADRQGQIPQLVVGRGDRNRQNLRFLRPFEGLVTAAAVFQQGVGDQMGQGAELQIPLVAASALSRPEIFQPGIVHREVQQSPHRVGQGELLQHRCRKNVAVHNSKDSWVNSRRCQIGTYDTDFVSAEKRQHPELTGLKGEAFLIRYADDFVIGVAREDDARRIMEVLPKRMSKYGLTVHPEKTRVVRFHPADVADSEPADQNSTGPRTFDFLGFTHYWGRSLKGGWVVKRKTAKGRLKRALDALSDWCRQHLHQPIAVQHQTLKQKLQGHYGYYGIIGNYASLQTFLGAARGIWKRWLSRRGRDKPLSWPEFVRLEQHYRLPPARVVHGLLSGAAKS